MAEREREQQARWLARDLDVDVGPLLARSVKSNVFHGERRGEPAVIKVLCTDEPLWRAYFEREVAIYRAFVAAAPPLSPPRLLAADVTRGVMVLERCDGRRLATGRAMRAGVRSPAATPEVIAALAEQLVALGSWQVEIDAPDFDPALRAALRARGERARPLPDPGDTLGWLRACVQRWRRRGLFGEAAATAAAEALESWLAVPAPRAFAHGDLLLRNIIVDGPRRRRRRLAGETDAAAPKLRVIDWEFAGAYPRGWDLGLLWAGLAGAARERLEAFIEGLADAELRVCVHRCRALAAARELEVRRGSLRQGDDNPFVARLRADVAAAVARLV